MWIRTSSRAYCSRATVMVLSLVLALHGWPLAAQPGNAVEDSVRTIERARGEALVRGDTAALSRMVADEFVEITRLGTVRAKADNIRDIASGALKLTSVKYDSLVVRLYGDVAVLYGVADNVGTFRGFPFTGKIRYMRIFVRRDGRWQAVAMQQTPMG